MAPNLWKLESFDQLDSTNNMARELANSGCPDRTMVIARTQTAGRGRHGRSWQSIPGNLLCTAVWRPDREWPANATIPLAIALAAKATIDRLAGAEITTIKWPNDILIDGRKICGILVEASSGAVERPWVIAGLGINVVAHPPNDTNLEATSLQAEGIFGPDARAVCDCLMEELDKIIPQWRSGDFPAIRDRYLAALHGKGKLVNVRWATDGPANLTGEFLDIAPDGRLVLKAGGDLHYVSVGDVFGIQK